MMQVHEAVKYEIRFREPLMSGRYTIWKITYYNGLYGYSSYIGSSFTRWGARKIIQRYKKKEASRSVVEVIHG
jgi:hypothetical protein